MQEPTGMVLVSRCGSDDTIVRSPHPQHDSTWLENDRV